MVMAGLTHLWTRAVKQSLILAEIVRTVTTLIKVNCFLGNFNKCRRWAQVQK